LKHSILCRMPRAGLERTSPRWSPAPTSACARSRATQALRLWGTQPWSCCWREIPARIVARLRRRGWETTARTFGRPTITTVPLRSALMVVKSYETLVREVSNAASAALWRAVVDSVGAAWVGAAAVSAYPELAMASSPRAACPARSAYGPPLTCARAVRQPRGLGAQPSTRRRRRCERLSSRAASCSLAARTRARRSCHRQPDARLTRTGAAISAGWTAWGRRAACRSR